MRYSITGITIEQVKSIGGQDIKEAPHINVIFATLTDIQIQYLRESGATVTPINKVYTAVMPPIPVAGIPTYTPVQLALMTGLDDLRNAISPSLYGEGFNIAIVDTGIRKTHQLINGQVVYTKNFTSSPDGDQFNHATGVASIALAAAPKCGILDLKVLDSNGMGTEEEVILAIEECIDLQDQNSEFAPTVINLSLGSVDTGDSNNILRIACRAAIEKKIWVSASAGNSGPKSGTVTSPACEKYVFASGSAKFLPDVDSFIVSEFSSRGPTLEDIMKPDCLAFGEDIEMASSVSDTATIAKSGTSFSAPFNSGIAILYHESVKKGYEIIHGRPPEWVPPGEYIGIVTMERLIDYWLGTFTIKPEGIPHIKDNDYGEGLAFGPLILESLKSLLKPTFDPSSMVSAVMTMVMLGMAIKMMR